MKEQPEKRLSEQIEELFQESLIDLQFNDLEQASLKRIYEKM